MTANPPYVASGEMRSLAPDILEFEPRLALDAGDDGLAVLRRIVDGAPAHLARPRGLLAVEIGAGEADAVVRLFEHAGFGAVDVRRDYARIQRVVSGVLHTR